MAVWPSSMSYADDAYPLQGSLNSLRVAIGDESFRRLMQSEVQLEMARAGVFSSQGVMPVTAKRFEQPRSWTQAWTGSSPRRRVIPWAQPVDINGDGCISPSEVALAESERRLELARAGLPLRGQDADMHWAATAREFHMAQGLQGWKDWSAFSQPASSEGVGVGWHAGAAWPASSSLSAEPGRSAISTRRPNTADVEAVPIGCPRDINQDGFIDGNEVALALSEERLRRVRAGLSPGPAGWRGCGHPASPPPLSPWDVYCSPEVAQVRTSPSRFEPSANWRSDPLSAARGQTCARKRVEFAEDQAPYHQEFPSWNSNTLPVDINGDGVIDSREAALAESERRLKQVQAESAFLASKSAAAMYSRHAWLPLLH
mmetsp:Transcript_979/g.2111  ORF Transcript_979/g.2111 Transcript_979/m.2111 type:complete len:373 (-) Transcript_979:103-1221(-)